jgi:putative resolvase
MDVMTKKYYRVAEAASYIGVAASTLRDYTNRGLVESTRSHAGHRLYTRQALDAFAGTQPETSGQFVFYTRASDGDQNKIDTQIQHLTSEYGAPQRIYKDKNSGLAENRPGLKAMLRGARKHKYTIIYITQKDRLARFGYSYLEELFGEFGVRIVVFGEEQDKTLQEELLQDFMTLVASFSGKYYRLRGYEQKRALLAKAGEVLNERETHQEET